MGEVFEKREISKKSQNISQWYQDVILKAGIAEYAPVRGCMIIKPYGYAVWEIVQRELDAMIKSDGVENAYFPLFIPQSLIIKEKKHVEGFSPELAVVTIGGGEKLKEPLIVRPTSETIMYQTFAGWISSWRDLPLKINQWGNVVRWEKRTYLFLRTTEFLWQEGHTVHETEKEAVEMAKKALEWYRRIFEEYLAVPVVLGRKSAAERFAGAKDTYTIEALMPDGKALQVATSHNLGQNFSKAFDIKYQDKSGKSKYVWQTSWGLTTRVLGGLFLTHGDDNGLVFPPKIAPIQAVIIAVSEKAKEYVQKIAEELKEGGVRLKVDSDFEHSLGWRINEWELKGVPVRIEIGEQEMQNNEVTVVRRNTNEKLKCQMSNVKTEIEKILEQVQKELFAKAKKFLEESTHTIDDYQEFKELMRTKKGFIKAFWCGNEKCEMKMKEETKATTRVLPFDAKEEKSSCIYCNKTSSLRWIFAQAY